MIMGIIWIVLLVLAATPVFFWKKQPLGQRLLAGLGIFTTPFGIALFLDGKPGGVFVVGVGMIAMIAVSYFDVRLRELRKRRVGLKFPDNQPSTPQK